MFSDVSFIIMGNHGLGILYKGTIRPLAPASKLNYVCLQKWPYIFAVIGPRSLKCENSQQEIMGWESLEGLDLTFDPYFKILNIFAAFADLGP